MRLARLMAVTVLVLPLSVLGGCVHQRSHQPLAIQAIGFNLTVEQAQNEMLLLQKSAEELPSPALVRIIGD
jgi:hypothetical protein